MLFSIVTINYNNLNGLVRTVKSVLNQQFNDFQYIIIDGCSTDGSKNFINSLNIKNSTLISEKDKGIYDAMNKGINQCNGEYVIFLNSGDFFPSDVILKDISIELNKSLEKIDFIYGDAYEYSSSTNKYFYKKSRSHSKAWYGMFSHHQSMLYSNAIIKTNGLRFNMQYKLSSDWDFTLRFLRYCNQLKKIDLAVSVFEQGGFSDNFIIGLNEQFSIRRKTLKFSVITCLSIYIYHFLLNSIRKIAPIFYQNIRMKKAEQLNSI